MSHVLELTALLIVISIVIVVPMTMVMMIRGEGSPKEIHVMGKVIYQMQFVSKRTFLVEDRVLSRAPLSVIFRDVMGHPDAHRPLSSGPNSLEQLQG